MNQSVFFPAKLIEHNFSQTLPAKLLTDLRLDVNIYHPDRLESPLATISVPDLTTAAISMRIVQDRILAVSTMPGAAPLNQGVALEERTELFDLGEEGIRGDGIVHF